MLFIIGVYIFNRISDILSRYHRTGVNWFKLVLLLSAWAQKGKKSGTVG